MLHADILALAGLRVDGRRPDEMRTINHRLGVTPLADGSAYYEQGLNKILVNVHGPQEPSHRTDDQERGEIDVQLELAPFSGSEWKKRRSGDKRSVEIETIVRQTFEGVVMLELYPRSEIVLVVHVLETDGSLLCAIINATTLALMHAGIAMRDMVVACSVGLVHNQLCQDCSHVEQNSGGAFMPIAIKARSEEILLISLDSRLSIVLLDAAMQQAILGCRKLRELLEADYTEYMVSAIQEMN